MSGPRGVDVYSVLLSREQQVSRRYYVLHLSKGIMSLFISKSA